VYQHRVSDEFIKGSDEARLPYLTSFADGFAKKIARGLDIAAFHGVDPATNTAADAVSGKSFDALVTDTVTYNASAVDDNIDDAVAVIQATDGEITGIAMSPDAGSALGKIKASGTGMYLYPEFRFGANPGNFGGMTSDINSTVAFGSSTDRAIVGDFQNAFKWGYAEQVPVEVIEYGDPDGLGDLKRYNQVVLRAEAYVGWGILDASSFVRIVSAK
jgi:HK97 family phage major capsid protein